MALQRHRLWRLQTRREEEGCRQRGGQAGRRGAFSGARRGPCRHREERRIPLKEEEREEGGERGSRAEWRE